MHILVLALLALATIVTCQKGRPPCTTEDNPNAFYFYNNPDKKLTCAELIKLDYCLCTKETVEKDCCASCKPHEAKLDGCSCRDTLSHKKSINVHDTETNIIVDRIRNCAKLVNNYASWCKDYGGGGGVCCQSCKSVDLNCVDDASKTFELGTKKYNCPRWIAKDKCYCMESPTAKACCASCKGQNLQGCLCRDTVSRDNPADIHHPETGEVIDSMISCRSLLKKYPQSCDDPDVKGEGGSCCKSCTGFDTSCLDLVNDKLPIILRDSAGKVKFHFTSCGAMRKSLPELCKFYSAKGCCKTCKNVDISCLDTKLTQWKKDGKTYDCAGYTQVEPCACETMSFKQKCCRSCKRVMKFPRRLANCKGCKNDPNWTKKDKPCKDCTCDMLLKDKRPKMVKRICRGNIGGIADHCCRTCRQMGVMVPKST